MCANEIIQKKSVSTILDACVYYYMQEKIICGPRFYDFFPSNFIIVIPREKNVLITM